MGCQDAWTGVWDKWFEACFMKTHWLHDFNFSFLLEFHWHGQRNTKNMKTSYALQNKEVPSICQRLSVRHTANDNSGLWPNCEALCRRWSWLEEWLDAIWSRILHRELCRLKPGDSPWEVTVAGTSQFLQKLWGCARVNKEKDALEGAASSGNISLLGLATRSCT